MAQKWLLKLTGNIAYNPVYTMVTGDLATGVLLSQLVYWFTPSKSGKTKLRVHRGGQTWLAKSRADLMEECGLSAWKLRAAMDRLRAMGLVTSEIHLFGGKTTPHLWVDLARVQSLVLEAKSSDLPVVRNPHNRLGGNLTTAFEESSQPYTETTYRDYDREKSAAPPQSGEVDLDFEITVEEPVGETAQTPQEGGKLVHVDFGRGAMKLDEIMKNVEARRERGPTGNGVMALVGLWKRRLTTITGGFVKEPTRQELGQFKMFSEKVGASAGLVLDFCLRDWATFAFEAKTAHGLGSAPTEPVIGFVLKHHDVAVQLVARSVKPVKTTTMHPTGVVWTLPDEPPAKAPLVTPEPSKASLDEVAEAMKMFGGSK